MAIVPHARSLVAAASLVGLIVACGAIGLGGGSGSTTATLVAVAVRATWPLSPASGGQTAGASNFSGLVTQTASVRTQASPDAGSVLGMIVAGTTIKVWARNPDHSWYLVEAPNDLIGWTPATRLSIDRAVIARIPSSAPSHCSCGAHAGAD